MTLRIAYRFTLLLAVAAAAAVAVQAQPMGPGAAQPASMHHRTGPGMGHGMGAGPMLSGRVLDSVGASAEQKSRVQDIFKAAQDDTRELHEGERGLQQQMMQLLAAPQIDAAAAEALRQKLQASRDAASKRMLQATLDASAVLSAEQRQKLAERIKSRRDMMDRHQRERQAAEPRG